MTRHVLARWAYFARSLPRALWQSVMLRVLLAISHRVTVCGLDVRVAPGRRDTDDVVHAIETALDLVATMEPRRLRRLKRDVATVLVRPDGDVAFVPGSRTCILTDTLLARRNAATLALALVHEGTHARITAAGVYPSESLMLRMERRCVREELGFALRLKAAGWGNIDHLIEHLRRDPAERPWWTREARVARRVATLEARGMPRWLCHVLARV